MKVVKKTGLVPVNDLRTGDIYGVSPAKAIEMVKAGIGSLVNIPEGVETIDVAGPDRPSEKKPEKPQETRTNKEESTEVEIPEDWDSDDFHHLKRIGLAKKILVARGTPDEDGSVKDAEAREIIADELQRRAAADDAE